jgi:D-alanyl-D-alanine carboxypeptidase
MTHFGLIVGIALAGLVSTPHALKAETAEAAVRQVLTETDAPGAAAGLLKAGRIETSVGGLRLAGQADAIAEGDLWHIGSNAKAMTATLVARLVEAGAMSWDDTVEDVLGEAIPDMNDAYRQMTYIELLSHRARLPANIGRLESLALAGSLADRDVRADRLAYATAVLTEPPEAEGFLYSNAGYVIAGAMLEAKMGAPWEDLIRAYVAKPLGMTTVGFGAPGVIGAADQPRGHSKGLLGGVNPVEPGPGSDNIPAMGPAGTLHLSVDDMMRFLRGHAEEDLGFLSAESWAILHQPAPGADYALGWRVEDGCLAHNGSNTLWFARMVICPDRKAAGFVVVNFGDIDALRAPVAAAVSALLTD